MDILNSMPPTLNSWFLPITFHNPAALTFSSQQMAQLTTYLTVHLLRDIVNCIDFFLSELPHLTHELVLLTVL